MACCFIASGGKLFSLSLSIDVPEATVREEVSYKIKGEVRNRGGSQRVSGRIYKIPASGGNFLEAEIDMEQGSQRTKGNIFGKYPILMKVRGGDGWDRMTLQLRKSELSLPIFGKFRLQKRLSSGKKSRQKIRGLSKI